MEYRLVDIKRAEEIAKLAVCLTDEIIERTGTKHFNVDIPLTVDLCNSFIKDSHYQVIAAFNDNNIVGFGALC